MQLKDNNQNETEIMPYFNHYLRQNKLKRMGFRSKGFVDQDKTETTRSPQWRLTQTKPPQREQEQTERRSGLNPELLRIQTMLKALLLLIRPLLQPVYLALNGHFGNYRSFLFKDRQAELSNSIFTYTA